MIRRNVIGRAKRPETACRRFRRPEGMAVGIKHGRQSRHRRPELFRAGVCRGAKNVLQRAEKPQVCYLGAQLFPDFSHDREFAGFTKINSTAQGPTIALVFDGIMCFVNKDATAKAENAKREWSNSQLRHVPVT